MPQTSLRQTGVASAAWACRQPRDHAAGLSDMAIAICTKAHASAEQNHGTRQLEAILNKGGTRMIAGIVLRAGVSAGVYFASGVLCALIFGCTSSQDDQHDTVPTVTFACNEVTMELELTTGQAQRILGIISRQPYESRLQEGEMKPGAFPYATFVVGGQRDYDWHMHMLW